MNENDRPFLRSERVWHIARNTPVTIVSNFHTLDEKPRVVISFDRVPGLLHIESRARLRDMTTEERIATP